MQILIIVVLYMKSPLSSETINSLKSEFARNPALGESYRVMIWDNSPDACEPTQLPFPCEYYRAGRNLGLARAYNHALKVAQDHSCSWLLLFDQDTTPADGFLEGMLSLAARMEERTEVATIAPMVFARGRVFSPVVVRPFHVSLLQPTFSGVHPLEVSSINSGMLMRVEALREIGGYDEYFWLDYSDTVVLHRLYLRGKRIYIAGELKVSHLPSVVDYRGSMTPNRYRNFIAAEGAYWDTYRSGLENLVYDARLIVRCIKQGIVLTDKEIAGTTLHHAWQRLSIPKRMRVRRWQQQLKAELRIEDFN